MTTRRWFRGAPLRRAFRSLARLAAASALAAPLLLAASPSRAGDEALPPGVEARVYGEEVTEAQVLDRLARRHEGTEKGRQILDQIVDDAIVGLEAKARGVRVTDEEVAAHTAKLMEVVKAQSGGEKTLADVLAETKTTEAEFRRTTLEYLLREKMAREDLGTKPGDDLPEHRMKLWMASMRRRHEVRTADLPEGVLAKVGDAVSVDRARFGRELRDRLPPEVVAEVRMELVLDVATRHRVATAGVVVTDADVDEQIARLRTRFESNPRVRGTGVTFDQFLRQTFGIGEAELRRDETFRSRVALERMLHGEISDEEIRAHWERNRDAYGDRALVRQVYVAAAEKGGKLDADVRSFADAHELVLRAKVAVLDRAGLLAPSAPGEDAPKKAPLAESVTAVAKQFAGSDEERKTAGEPAAWTRGNVAGEPALEKAAFEGDPGQLVGPVRSRIGWHLLLVEERRPAPTWEEVRDRVRDDLLRLAIRRFQLEIRVDPEIVLR